MIFLSVFVIYCIMLLTLMSDLHLISPTISPSNHSFKVMRMKEMIPNFKGS